MKENIVYYFDIISNIKWDIIFWIKIIFDNEFRQLIFHNKKLKNLYYGKRCFIVGNGPSLNKNDLSKISDEIVFTVNSIVSNKNIYDKVNTDYHVFIDPLYFQMRLDNSDHKERIEVLKSINYEKKKPLCITAYEGKNALKVYGLNNQLELRYLYQHKIFIDSKSIKIDMCRNFPISQNVIQAAIFSAIYMGFKEIYLIGCDMTSIFVSFECNSEGKREIKNDFHAYTYSKAEMKLMQENCDQQDNEYILYDYARTFTIFKQIKRYSERNGIKILNATEGGGLDVFKRINYNSLWN